jgi:hypothetical protein
MLEFLLDYGSKALPALYLSAVVALFLRLEAAHRAHIRVLTELVDRYHAQVGEQIHTLTLINERLDK